MEKLTTYNFLSLKQKEESAKYKFKVEHERRTLQTQFSSPRWTSTGRPMSSHTPNVPLSV